MKVLAIDTSNQIMSIALIDGSKVLAEYTTNVNKNHSVRLMPAINNIMSEAGVLPEELDKIAVAIGPGSYTGVRIGVTTAKTFAWSLKIPIVAVSSLEIVAYNGLYFDGKICPFFDARRGQVYTGLYKSTGEQVEAIAPEKNILFEEWLEDLTNQDEKVLFLSNDIDIHKHTIDKIMGEKAVYAPAYLAFPKASVLGTISKEKDEIENIHELVPNYLRLVEAEVKWLEKQGKNKDE